MELQEFFKYDPLTVGLEGIFHKTEDGYFLNSSCLLSPYQIIKLNQIYLLFCPKDDASEEISYVQLMDVFFDDGFVNLYIRDIVTMETTIISHYLASGYLVHQWRLIQLDFLMEMLKNGYEFDFNNQTSNSLEELFAGLHPFGKYSHLQIILSRNGNREMNQKFLMVTPSAFGVVRIDDVDFDGSQIQLSIEDCTTGFKKLVPINVNNKEFQFLMISWDDIRSMVMAENKSMLTNDDLLDFE